MRSRSASKHCTGGEFLTMGDKTKLRLVREILRDRCEPRSCGPMFRDIIAATLMRMPTDALEELAQVDFVFFAPFSVFGAAFPAAQLRLPKSRSGFVVYLAMDILRQPP